MKKRRPHPYFTRYAHLHDTFKLLMLSIIVALALCRMVLGI